jgi:hypothetical protein
MSDDIERRAAELRQQHKQAWNSGDYGRCSEIIVEIRKLFGLPGIVPAPRLDDDEYDLQVELDEQQITIADLWRNR